VKLHEGDADLGAGVQMHFAPGHTPGHSVMLLDLGSEQVLVLGDTAVSDHIIDDREALFHSTVFSAADREAPYAIVGLLDNLDESQQHIHSTDTHGNTKQAFTVTHFIRLLLHRH